MVTTIVLIIVALASLLSLAMITGMAIRQQEHTEYWHNQVHQMYFPEDYDRMSL